MTPRQSSEPPAMLSTDPNFVAWEKQARPELLRSIQERDNYPPTDSEDDLHLMEDSSLDQAAILWGDMLAIREAMMVIYKNYATHIELVSSRRHCKDGTIRIMFHQARSLGFSIKYVLWVIPVARPRKEPQVQFAQTNKAFLLQAERYQQFPNAMTSSTKRHGFTWLKRQGTKKNRRI
ncbi:hypothetical protein N7G274_009502 [Stereocaulon virgatum]|uniref:Uncharacterized protein n=1 Tax=Stereocaulon virgatum TaxID=373712 RepID=A0ABR3ZVZ7_9LECA